MPVLDISQHDPEIKALLLTAIMCFPSEKEGGKRLHWLLKGFLHIAADEYVRKVDKTSPEKLEALSGHIGKWLGESIVSAGGSWASLANATIGAGQKKPPGAEARKRHDQGVVIGWAFRKAVTHGQGILKCAELWKDDVQAMKQMPDCKFEPSVQDPKFIYKTLWPRFKDAAHLWAAYTTIGRAKKQTWLLPFDQYEPDGLSGFLQLADYCLQQGISTFPPRGPRKPLLDPEKAWRVSV